MTVIVGLFFQKRRLKTSTIFLSSWFLALGFYKKHVKKCKISEGAGVYIRLQLDFKNFENVRADP